MGISAGCFSVIATFYFLLFFSPWLQHGALPRPPSSQRPHSSWVSMYTSIPCASCLDCLLLGRPVFLKLVARSYPKPNNSPSAVKNVLTWDSLSPAVTRGFSCTLSRLVCAEKGGKAFLIAQEKQIPKFYSSSWTYPLFRCPVKWGWRLLALGIWQKGTIGAEKICGMVCGLSGHVWAMWVDDLQVLAAEPSHLCDVWNAVSWKVITFPQTSTHSWVRQKAEISVPEMELHCVRSLLWTLQYERISN